MEAFKEWAVARLRERSTWLGILAIAAAFGLNLAPEQAEAIATAGTILAGVILAGTRDKPGA